MSLCLLVGKKKKYREFKENRKDRRLTDLSSLYLELSIGIDFVGFRFGFLVNAVIFNRFLIRWCKRGC
ncbi:hypothetical protein FRX31_033582 [Thalictrum thalictroides]|uniref:Uncharacterized protein n=1 Tax=Thalictrum thalictroides TaxID=46969 RepID=A0A7J6UXB8_THATH|nr:hypothetical protein FRX31_033582 [Thalictrum thalictroides]